MGVACLSCPSSGIHRALLPASCATELAVVAAATRRTEGSKLLDALGAPARRYVPRFEHARETPPGERVCATSIAVDVLGPLALRRGDVEVADPGWRRQRVRELLLLLVDRGRITREEAAATLWPESEGSRARASLRVHLSYLLRVLDPQRDAASSSFIRQESGSLELVDERLRVDVWEFERLLDAAEVADAAGDAERALDACRQALSLYRGDYLQDARYADWVGPRRDALRSRFVKATLRAGALLMGVHRGPEEAVRLAIRALEIEPWSESLYRLLIEAQAAAGDRAAARRAIGHCLAMLAELDAPLEPETSALIERLEVVGAAVPRADLCGA